MKNSFILKEECHTLLQKHPYLYDWLTEDILYGVWYCNFKNSKEFYINESFKKTLEYPSSIVEGSAVEIEKILLPEDNVELQMQISSCKKNSSEGFNAIFQFKNSQNQNIALQAIGKTILDSSANKKGLLIKFLKPENTQVANPHLIDEIHELKKLHGIYDETNEMARVGGWEVDLVTGSLIWTKVTKDIHEVPLDFVPDLSGGINFYKEGYYRAWYFI